MAGGEEGAQGYGQTLRQLQAEVASLRRQLRAQLAQTTKLRGREVELRLTNEGLMEVGASQPREWSAALARPAQAPGTGPGAAALG